MKKNILLTMLINLIVLGNPYSACSQNVGVSGQGLIPNVSALLDVDAAGMSPKGVLIPRITLTSQTDVATIATPAHSLMVYNTGTGALTPEGYYYNLGTAGAANWVSFLTNDVNPMVAEGRLTLTTGNAIPTTNVTAATTVYFTPYKGNRMAIYGSSQWYMKKFSQLSIGVPATANRPFDIFIYDNAGTLALETVLWTDDLNRATGVTLLDGVPVKTGNNTRRYLGTCRTIASGQTEDSEVNRYVWNYYNRINESAFLFTTTDESTTSASFVDLTTPDLVNFVIGEARIVTITWSANVYQSLSGANNRDILVVDGTSIGETTLDLGEASANMGHTSSIVYRSALPEGKHAIKVQHIAQGGGTAHWRNRSLLVNVGM